MPTMEALSFFKLWKMSPAIPPPEYDDDDSFFDLDLNVRNYDLNRPKLTEISSSESDEDDESFESKSPISFLRSPANFPIFSMFRKRSTDKTDSGAGDQSPSILGRVNSSRRKMQRPKDVVSRYLRRMKVRVARSSGENSPESPLMKAPEVRQGMRSPSMRIVCKRLGKTPWAAPVGGVLPAASVSGDLVLHNDGIQSAILHCKRSYNSSRDLSVLSRSVSEPVISGNPSRFSIEEKKRDSI